MQFSSYSHSEDLRPVWFFYTGNSYLDMIEKNSAVKGIETLYVKGLNDALTFYRNDEWIYKCSSGKSSTQLTAIFNKWLQKNPEQWLDIGDSGTHNILIREDHGATGRLVAGIDLEEKITMQGRYFPFDGASKFRIDNLHAPSMEHLNADNCNIENNIQTDPVLLLQNPAPATTKILILKSGFALFTGDDDCRLIDRNTTFLGR